MPDRPERGASESAAAGGAPGTEPAAGAGAGASAASLLDTPVSVVNVGLESFALELAAQGVPVVHVDWKPPAGGDPRLAALLAKLGT